MGRGMDNFPKIITDGLQMAKYMKRYSISLISVKIQIKTTMSYHLTPIRIAFVEKTRNNKC